MTRGTGFNNGTRQGQVALRTLDVLLLMRRFARRRFGPCEQEISIMQLLAALASALYSSFPTTIQQVGDW